MTRPAAETEATLLSLDDQVTGRPASTFPVPSKTTAVACAVWPMATGEVTITATLATGGKLTTRSAEPLWPSLEAVMLAVPTPRATTLPPGETVATDGEDEVQVTVRPVSRLPLASRSTAVAVVAWPATSVLVSRDTVTVATIGGVLSDEPPQPATSAARRARSMASEVRQARKSHSWICAEPRWTVGLSFHCSPASQAAPPHISGHACSGMVAGRGNGR